LLFEIAFLISGLLSAGFEAESRGISAGKRGKGQEGERERERDDELAVCSRSFGIDEGVAAAARADLPPDFGKLRRGGGGGGGGGGVLISRELHVLCAL
jgi:hypothetical protein